METQFAPVLMDVVHPDWTTTLNLVDPTMGTSGDVFKANLFAVRADNLPCPNEGDIIIFTDINVSLRSRPRSVGSRAAQQAVTLPPPLVRTESDREAPREAAVRWL